MKNGDEVGLEKAEQLLVRCMIRAITCALYNWSDYLCTVRLERLLVRCMIRAITCALYD
jgi:hypothetical protein